MGDVATLLFELQHPPARGEGLTTRFRAAGASDRAGELEGEPARTEATKGIDGGRGSALLLDEQQDPVAEEEAEERDGVGDGATAVLLPEQLHFPPRRQLHGLRSWETIDTHRSAAGTVRGQLESHLSDPSELRRGQPQTRETAT